MKNEIKKKGTAAAVVIAVIAVCIGMASIKSPSKTSKPVITEATTAAATETSSETVQEETTTEEETTTYSAESTSLKFELKAGEPGEYGREYIYNEGTETEDRNCVYFVPYGIYKVTNIGDYMAQVNVYSDEKRITEYGWEEPAEGENKLIDVGETVEMTVYKDFHIDINEPTDIMLEQISSESIVKEIRPQETYAEIEEDEIYEETRQYIEDIVKDSYPNSKVSHQKGTKQFSIDIYPEGFKLADDPIKTEEDRTTWENIISQYCNICLLIYQNVESKGIDDPEITLFVISSDDPPQIALFIYNGAVISNALE